MWDVLIFVGALALVLLVNYAVLLPWRYVHDEIDRTNDQSLIPFELVLIVCVFIVATVSLGMMFALTVRLVSP